MAKPKMIPNDPKLPGGTDKCRCAACGEYFNSTYAFEQHRKGTYSPDTRHCLSTADLSAARWTVSPTGPWLTPNSGRKRPVRLRQKGRKENGRPVP